MLSNGREQFERLNALPGAEIVSQVTKRDGLDLFRFILSNPKRTSNPLESGITESDPNFKQCPAVLQSWLESLSGGVPCGLSAVL